MTFFSGTDSNTLIEEGSCMPHFVSLIVNNAGKYTAKITRQANLMIPKITYPTFGGETKEEDCELTINKYIEAFPLDIVIEEDTSIRDNVLKRISEIRKNKEEQRKDNDKNSLIIPCKKDFEEFKSSFEKDIKKDITYVKKEKPKEESLLFSKKEIEEIKKDYSDISVPEEILDRLLIQLVTGSITSGYNRTINLELWCEKPMIEAFTRRFNNDYSDIESWFDFYIEFLLYFTKWEEVERIDDEIISKVIAEALLERLAQFKPNKIIDIIENKLEDFIQ